jgi:hypothetical protein
VGHESFVDPAWLANPANGAVKLTPNFMKQAATARLKGDKSWSESMGGVRLADLDTGDARSCRRG